MKEREKMAPDFISQVSSKEIERGDLSRLFGGGVRAVILRDDDRISRLNESVFEWLGFSNSRNVEAKSFEKNLFDLARNHISGNMGAGDVLRFQPGHIVYIARKFVVYRSTADQLLKSFPDTFRSLHRSAPVPETIKELVSNLMLEIFTSALPDSSESLSSYAIQVEILVYPSSRSEVDELAAILGDSSGRWSRWGKWVDGHMNNAHGVFDVKFVRDLYALACLLPLVRRVLETINRNMTSATAAPEGYFLLGRPHTDSGKYITALTGCRENLHTQVLDAKTWGSLDVTPNTLAIFPSPEMATQNGIPATVHRILLTDLPHNGTGSAQNVSLSLSIIDRPEWLH